MQNTRCAPSPSTTRHSAAPNASRTELYVAPLVLCSSSSNYKSIITDRKSHSICDTFPTSKLLCSASDILSVACASRATHAPQRTHVTISVRILYLYVLQKVSHFSRRLLRFQYAYAHHDNRITAYLAPAPSHFLREELE